MIKGAQTKLRGMKKFKEFKSLSMPCEIANMMMVFKTKKRKQRQEVQAQHQGHRKPFCQVNPKIQESFDQKEGMGASTSDPSS